MSTDDSARDNREFDIGALTARLMAKHADKLDAVAAERGTVLHAVASSPDRGAARRIELLVEGGFPARAVDAVRGELRSTPAVDFARSYAAGPPATLALLGGVGAGKTVAGTWIALTAGGIRPGFLRATELERRGRYDAELHAWLASRTSLVLDDLGAEYADGKGAFASLLDEVIDRMYGEKRRMVITANLTIRLLRERVGERVWSRFLETGEVVEVGAVDLRRAG